MSKNLEQYLAGLLTLFVLPLGIAFGVLIPAFFAMIAINCILDIHYPGHHVGYGEAYAISYLISGIGSGGFKTISKKDDK